MCVICVVCVVHTEFPFVANSNVADELRIVPIFSDLSTVLGDLFKFCSSIISFRKNIFPLNQAV